MELRWLVKKIKSDEHHSCESLPVLQYRMSGTITNSNDDNTEITFSPWMTIPTVTEEE